MICSLGQELPMSCATGFPKRIHPREQPHFSWGHGYGEEIVRVRVSYFPGGPI
jgi:hypothetical protein